MWCPNVLQVLPAMLYCLSQSHCWGQDLTPTAESQLRGSQKNSLGHPSLGQPIASSYRALKLASTWIGSKE